MRVRLLSYDDGGAGAGRAAFRLHRALREHGVDSLLQVRRKTTDSTSVVTVRPLVRKAVGRITAPLTEPVMALQRGTRDGKRSPGWLSSGIVDELNACDADVLQLNFICGMLSVEEIGRIRKPLVWRLSDMWAFSGTEHYSDDGPSARWRVGYTRASRPSGDRGPDLDGWTWRRKRRAWQRPIHIVTPSNWLAGCVRESALMATWPVSVIPTAIDTRQFQPWPRSTARDVLGLPRDMRLVLFGANSGGVDPRKGRDILHGALQRLGGELENVAGVIFGQSEPADPPRLGVPLYWMGNIHDEPTLALLYSAADVMVIPSRQDNLPQTGIESQSCGCPVVTFDASGMRDVIDDRRTGYLARPFEVEDITAGIRWIVERPERNVALANAARARSLRLWAPEVVVPQYRAVYEHVIAGGE